MAMICRKVQDLWGVGGEEGEERFEMGWIEVALWATDWKYNVTGFVIATSD